MLAVECWFASQSCTNTKGRLAKPRTRPVSFALPAVLERALLQNCTRKL